MSTPYFRWFAWHPVWTVDRGWVWLRRVWKKHVPPLMGVQGAIWTWRYRVELP